MRTIFRLASHSQEVVAFWVENPRSPRTIGSWRRSARSRGGEGGGDEFMGRKGAGSRH